MVFARRSSSIAAALLAVLGLCGCVAQEPVAAASSSSASVFDRNERWAPEQSITLPPMTMEQKLEFRLQWLDAEWQSVVEQWPELADEDARPTVELVSFGDPIGGDELLAQCFTDAGYPAVAEEGGVSFPGGVQASPQYGLAHYVCYSKFTPDPLMLRDWNDDQLGLLWEYLTQWRNPCLESFGLVTREGPDRASFINEFFTDGSEARAWAFSDPTIGSDNRDDILAACPSLPREHFYGS